MNKKIVVYSFIIIIMLVLSIRVIKQGEGYTCESCEIEFKTKIRSFSGETKVLRYKIQDLVNNYNQGECLVRWDKEQGYIGETYYELNNPIKYGS